MAWPNERDSSASNDAPRVRALCGPLDHVEAQRYLRTRNCISKLETWAPQ
ncbi:uncharacterized protein G2W53_006964 [Senna tora]|uniref:Uncharacterized protein n=1 Tax=Senna tora TaxID=362788 RepID=A0A834X632_9FABA|nr:uncharacterized protein G2W53_006964 [Senna tora]